MASIYRCPPQTPGANFWIAFYHPRSGQLIRLPLDTNSRTHAERIRQHVAYLCKAASPSAPVLPPRLQEALGVPPQDESPALEPDNGGGRFLRIGTRVLVVMKKLISHIGEDVVITHNSHDHSFKRSRGTLLVPGDKAGELPEALVLILILLAGDLPAGGGQPHHHKRPQDQRRWNAGTRGR